MPTYPYLCPTGHRWEVAKRMADIDVAEACPSCQTPGVRQIARVNFNGASDWNRAEWNPGLGCYTKGSKDITRICKERGLEEVGSTSPETIHKMQDTAREERRRTGWEKAKDDALRDLQDTGVSL